MSTLTPPPSVAGWPPPPPPPTSYPPPPPAPVERHRAKGWIVGVALLVALIVGSLVMWGLDETLLRHDLVETSFTDGPEPFVIGTHGDFSYQVVDGRYVVTTRSVPSSAATSLGDFTRIAHAVDASATIAQIDSPNDPIVGISVASPGDASDAYQFACSRDSCALMRLDGDDGHEVLAETTDGLGPRLEGRTFTISVSPDLFGDDVKIRCSIDGREVITVTDTAGFTDYGYVGLLWFDERVGSSASFDDVVAVVPGE